jgi:hypothetical protein
MRTSPRRSGSRRSRRSARGLLQSAAFVLTALALSTTSPSTAYAAEGSLCTDGGVNVVVDFKDLGGVQQACAETGAGKVATEVFEEAGFELTPVGAFPGAACRVDGRPAGVACAKMPPADAYWGLYVGTAGTWDYAPTGADELTLEDGAFVGFAWQSSSTSSPPEVAPVAQQPSQETSNPATVGPSDAAEDTDDAEQDSGIAWWVPAVLVVALATGGLAVVLRRRNTESQ